MVAKPLRLDKFVQWKTATGADDGCRITLCVALSVPGLEEYRESSTDGEARPATNIGTLVINVAAGGEVRWAVTGTLALRAPIPLKNERKSSRDCLISFDLDGANIAKASLRAILYGRIVTFEQTGEAASGSEDFGIVFKPKGLIGPVANLSATLHWGSGQKASLALEATLVAASYLVMDFGSQSISWLGAKLSEPPIAVNHDLGVISFDFEKKDEEWQPVVGIPFTCLSIRGLLSVGGVEVQGFVNIVASGSGEDTQSRLRHNWWSGTDSTLEIDLHCAGTSLVSWPTGAAAIPVHPSTTDTPESEHDQALTVKIAAESRQLHHTVSALVQGYPIQATDLAKEPGDALYSLKAPLRLLMRVEHSLSEGTRAIKWVSLDDVLLVDVTGLASEAGSKEHSFAARYRYGQYRGIEREKDVPAPGVVRRALASTELTSEEMVGALENCKGLLLIGGSQLLIRAEPTINEHYIALGLPWMLPYSRGTVVWPDFTQQGDGKTWQAAWFDRRSPHVVPAASSISLAVGHAIYARLMAHVGFNASDQNAPARTIEFVEQSFVDLPGWKDNPPPVKITPLFMRSLIALVELWALPLKESDLQHRLIQPIVLEDEHSRLVRLSPGQTRTPNASGPICVEIGVLRRSGMTVLPLDSAKDAKPEDAMLSAMALRELVDRKMPDWIAAQQIEIQYRRSSEDPAAANDKAAAEVAAMRKGEPLFNHHGLVLPSLVLRPSGESLFAAASRGWPSKPDMIGAKNAALRRDRSQPFQNPLAGIAGRLNAFASTAGAGSHRPYLTATRQVLFQPGPIAEASGAWPWHQMMLMARPTGPQGEAPTIVPSSVVTGSIGLRPGVFHAETTALLMPSVPGTGTAAFPMTFQPAVVHQHRTPRSTRLPDNQNWVWRRRTFVIRDGERKPRLPWQVYNRPLAGFRTYCKDTDPTEIPVPDKLLLLRFAEGSGTLADDCSAVTFLFDKPDNEADTKMFGGAAFRLLVDPAIFPLVVKRESNSLCSFIADAAILQGASTSKPHFHWTRGMLRCLRCRASPLRRWSNFGFQSP